MNKNIPINEKLHRKLKMTSADVNIPIKDIAESAIEEKIVRIKEQYKSKRFKE